MRPPDAPKRLFKRLAPDPLPHSRSRLLRSAPSPRVQLLLAESSAQLCAWAGDDAFDLAVLQPCFGFRADLGEPRVVELTRLASLCSPERLVLYLCRPLPPPFTLHTLGSLGFPFVLVHGEDARGWLLLRAVARASVRRRLRGRFEARGGLPEPDLELLLRLMAGWPPASGVPQAARQMSISPRHLGRTLVRRGLPPPGALLMRGVFLETHMLDEMEAASWKGIAMILGARGSANLSHRIRRLTGRSPSHFVGPRRKEDPFDWVVEEILSRPLRGGVGLS